MIEVCAAAIVRVGADGRPRVLVARRTRPPELAGRWEFPGGKLEAGETPATCLVRELREELALEVEVGDALGTSVGPTTGRDAIRLTAYAARTKGAFRSPELIDGTHDRVAWVDERELREVDLAPLDIPLVVGVVRFLRAFETTSR